MEKAYALRDRREAERRKQVQAAYDTLWRDGCDDLRDLDGKALNMYMGAERQRQIEEKEKRRALDEINANSYYAEWTKQLEALSAADDAKKARREANMRNNAFGILAQIEGGAKMKLEQYERTQAEADAEIAANNAAIAEDGAREALKKQQAVQRGREVLAFNSQFQQMAREKEAVEFERDSILLNNALKLEREQLAMEQEKRRAGAEAARQYRKYLEELMVKEAEDSGFVEAMNKSEADKVQKARDDALQARQDARDYLMKKVAEGRAEQIQAKKDKTLQETEEDKIYAKKFLEDMKQGVEMDRAAAEKRRAINLDNQQLLLSQITAREAARELEKQEEYLDDKRTQLVEKRHRERLNTQGGVVRLQFPKRRPDTR